MSSLKPNKYPFEKSVVPTVILYINCFVAEAELGLLIFDAKTE